MIKVFGHKSPDTDTTGSAIVWAWHLRERQGLDASAFLLGPPNKEARFVLDRWDLDVPPIIDDVDAGDEVVIVDTNNPGELPDSIRDARIIEIIDHHLLSGGLATMAPITVTMRPVACTVTVMHELMGNDASTLPDSIRGVMLSCIISDTMAFRSPTTTTADHDLAVSLASSLDVDIDHYAAEMFAAKSDLSGYSDAELLGIDAKLYDLGGRKLRISVLETTTPGQLLDRKDGIMDAIEAETANGSADHMLLFIVDILNESAILLLPNQSVRDIARNSFNVDASGDSVALPGVVSRKKQIIPRLAV